MAPCGDRLGVGNDVHTELIAVHLIHGERGSIKGDGAFLGDEAGDVIWCLETKTFGVAFRRDGNNFAQTIDMTGDDMAPSSSPIFKARSRLMRCRLQFFNVVLESVSAEASTVNVPPDF
jgi:hypothetical protein